jgi:hypothetical protein
MDPHLFVTRDFGATFTDITGNLPSGIGSYVTIEDPVNPNLLFVGTEFGVYASIEGGNDWFKLDSGMPNVAVRDLLIHPRDADLVAGTHGRSIWILDDITPLRQMTREVEGSAVHLFDNRTATKWVTINLGRKQPDFLFRGPNPPSGAAIDFWLGEAPQGEVTLEVSEFTGDRVATVRMGSGGGFRGRGGRGGFRGGRGSANARGPQRGINRAFWNFQFPSTEAERAAMRARLVAAVDDLDRRVIEDDRRARLADLRGRLAEADDDRALNEIRNQLAGDFNDYGTGDELFGPQIDATTAAAGTYRVTLTVDGQAHEGSITIRDDPMMAEHGGR